MRKAVHLFTAFLLLALSSPGLAGNAMPVEKAEAADISCANDAVCAESNAQQKADAKAGEPVKSKPWVTIDEPTNFALLLMGLVGLVFGRWAAKRRISDGTGKKSGSGSS